MACQHLYGFSEGCSAPGEADYEPPELILDPALQWTADEVFCYCPRCGEALTVLEE